MMEAVLGPIPCSMAQASKEAHLYFLTRDWRLNWPGAAPKRSIRCACLPLCLHFAMLGCCCHIRKSGAVCSVMPGCTGLLAGLLTVRCLAELWCC